MIYIFNGGIKTMKYYNFESMFISLVIKLGDFLKENNIYFEIS